MRQILYILTLCFVQTCMASSAYLELTRTIYCPTCQGQVLEESNSPVAIEMKHEIQEMLEKGMQPAQIKLHYVQRYGEKVLTEPTYAAHNYVLWLLPIVAFCLLLIMAFKRMHFVDPKK